MKVTSSFFFVDGPEKILSCTPGPTGEDFVPTDYLGLKKYWLHSIDGHRHRRDPEASMTASFYSGSSRLLPSSWGSSTRPSRLICIHFCEEKEKPIYLYLPIFPTDTYCHRRCLQITPSQWTHHGTREDHSVPSSGSPGALPLPGPLTRLDVEQKGDDWI